MPNPKLTWKMRFKIIIGEVMTHLQSEGSSPGAWGRMCSLLMKLMYPGVISAYSMLNLAEVDTKGWILDLRKGSFVYQRKKIEVDEGDVDPLLTG